MSKQIFEEMQQSFLENCAEVEAGNYSVLDCAVRFREEYEYLTALAEDRKAWMNEWADELAGESEQYGKDGYKGLIFTKQTKETLSYKSIPEWAEVDRQRKEIEERSKLALKMVRKGGLNVDENGEEIPLPEVKVTNFIKVEKVKPIN